MSNSRRNNVAGNKAAEPQTLAEFYEHAWKVIFKKLPSDEQQEILAAMHNNKSSKVFSKFAKNVAELGEEMFDKSSKAAKGKE